MMTNRLRRNKKGDDMLVDFFLVIAFAVVIVVFLILFSIDANATEKNVAKDFENKDTNYMLESFLRAPAVGIDDDKTVADIITEESVTGDFKRTQQLFKGYFNRMDNVSTLELTIEGIQQATIKIERTAGLGFFDKVGILISTRTWIAGAKHNADTYIPGPERDIHIILEKDENIAQS